MVFKYDSRSYLNLLFYQAATLSRFSIQVLVCLCGSYGNLVFRLCSVTLLCFVWYLEASQKMLVLFSIVVQLSNIRNAKSGQFFIWVTQKLA